MKVLLMILVLAISGWSQISRDIMSPSYRAGPAKVETEDQELRRLLKLPDPPPYVAPKQPEPSELDRLKAENARLKAEAQQASYNKWMTIYAEMMELDRPRREAEQMEFNQQMMLWEMQKQTQIMREQQQLEDARQRWINNQNIWNPVNPFLYQQRLPNCVTGPFSHCW